MDAIAQKIEDVFSSHHSRAFLIISMTILVAALSVVLVIVPLLTAVAPSQTHYTHNIAVAAEHDSSYVPPLIEKNTQYLAQSYMSAFVHHQYASMWPLLDASIQTMWPNEAAFERYWQGRFRGYTLQQFSVGRAHWLTQWVNPETMQTYNHVIMLPVSLQLAPVSVPRLSTEMPPEMLHPDALFQNLPFIVQQVASHGKMQWQILAGGPADLEAPILPPMQPVNTVVHVPILMYHYISPDVPTTFLGKSLTVTPAMFTQQMDYLKKQGYHTITFNQLFDALYYGGPLPSHPIILTFDDGYDNAYTYAFPILKAHGFSGMFYIITGKVEWKAYLTWAQIRALLAGGMQIGSHTVHHVDMGATLLYSRILAQQELQQSQATLQQKLGIPIQQFCYPSGEPFRNGSLYAQQQIVALLAADGYIGATTDPGMTGTEQRGSEPFVLLRLRVDGHETLQEIEQKLLW